MKLRNFLILAVLMATSMLALGQAASTGTILGHVEDSGGASIAGAKVTILNTATGIDHVVITNQDGEYTAPGLQPGSYKVTIEAPGFGSKVSSVGLVVAQQERVDAALKLGGAVETVTVEASGGAQLDTDSAAISQLVSEKQVNQLPLNGRNFLNLLFIGAGAVQTVGEQGQMRGGEGNAISISGARPESNNYTLDGIVNTDTALSTPAVILSQDAIQEFKVQSETYSAEFGFSANQVNIVSKSGTNQFHGSLFEFNRNDAFDANTHFQAIKPVLRQNQFGFVLSGPVWIPKIFNGHDKTFFLANYEGARIKAGTSPTNQFVPDPAQLSGNFAGSGLPAFGSDACTAALKAGNACQPIDPTTGLPFLNDSIPTTRFSNLAKVALGANLFPAPNEPGVTNGYVLRTVLPNSTDQQTYRVDQNLKKYGSVFGRYTRAQYLNNSAGTVSVPYGLNVFTENSVSWQINHTISIGQNNVNNFRYGNLSAKSIQGVSPAPASAVAALGLSGIFTNLPDYARGYPNISIGGGPASVGSPGNDPTTSDIPQYEIADSFTSIHGRHTLSLGFDFRNWIQKRDLSSNFLGSYSYASATVLTNGGTSDGTTQNATNPCATAYCGTGNATADFLLGYYSGASTFQPGPFSIGSTPGNLNQFHFKYFAPYVQDDWKVTSNLTVNLGLRYDFRTIPYETDNKLFWIDKANAQGGLCFANPKLLTDGIAPAGNGFYRYCGRNNPRDAAKLPFAPRIGFAYRPFGDNKTVVRGGYGLYFDSTETREIDDSGDLYPYVVRTSINPVTAPNVPKVTDNLFPATAALHPVSVATDGGQFVAVIISENPINPYVQQPAVSALPLDVGELGVTMAPPPTTHEIAELELHSDARVNRFEEKAAFAATPDLYAFATNSLDATSAIAKSDVIDLTAKMKPDGTLDWTPLAGRWTVLRMGYSLTGITNHPAPPEATGPEVDKLSKQDVSDYFNHYLDNYKDATAGMMGKRGLKYVITDSWEAGTQNWTDQMIAEFTRRRGYDPRPWLPVMTGRIIGSAEESDRFLWDVRKTIADLLAENYYGTIAAILHERGMGQYGESHEEGRATIGDGMEMKKADDVPMSATWTQQTGVNAEQYGYNADVRESASVAHIYGQNLVAAESLTASSNPWGWSPATLKPTADKELANGLNRFVIHESAHQPLIGNAPGLTLGPFGQWFNRNEIWAEQAGPWMTYLARSSWMLQQGHFVADIVYFYGEDSNLTAIFGAKSPDVPKGYAFDYINADALIHELKVKDGSLTTKSGMSYRVLVLDPYSSHMSLPVLRAIQQLVEDGAVVIGEQPIGTPSLADDAAQFHSIASEMWASQGTYGKGRVIHGMSVADALTAASVPKDFTYTQTDADSEVLFVHRKVGDTDLYYVDNRRDRKQSLTANFRVTGRAAEIWHADTGKSEAASYTIANGSTSVPLQLEPYETAFVVFRKPPHQTSVQLPSMHEAVLAPVSGPWNVQFEAGRGAPAQAQLPELASLSDNADKGIRYFSGHATYTKTIDAPAAWFHGKEALWLDLGDVANLAEVKVNGQPLGIVWKAPYRVDVSKSLKPGKNTIEIRVANLWVNRLIGDAQPDATTRYTFTTHNPYKASSKLVPSGLIGPVQILRKEPGGAS